LISEYLTNLADHYDIVCNHGAPDRYRIPAFSMDEVISVLLANKTCERLSIARAHQHFPHFKFPFPTRIKFRKWIQTWLNKAQNNEREGCY